MTSSRRTALVVAIVAVLVAAGVITRADRVDDVPAVRGPRVTSARNGAATWYCAEGTANPEGRADEEIVIGNVGARPSRATVTVMSGSDATQVRREYAVPAGQVTRVPVSEIAAVGEPGVIVEVEGGRSVVEHRIRRGADDAVGPCARESAVSAEFAAGTTIKGAELWIALFNPFPDDAIVDVRAITGAGLRAPSRLQGIVVPRYSRVSVPVHEAIPRVDLVATRVVARRGRVITEESIALDGSDGRSGLALSLGRDRARRWWFPNALIGSGRNERLLLANPAARDVRATVRFPLDAAAALEPVTLLLPGESVTAVDLNLIPPDFGFSVVITARRPIVAEMIATSGPPQGEDVRGIASSLGLTGGSVEWAVVPARVGATSADVLAVVSTDGRAHRVTIERTDGKGRRVMARVRVPPTGRALLHLDQEVDDPALALVLRSDGPVAVERESARPGITRSAAIPR